MSKVIPFRYLGIRECVSPEWKCLCVLFSLPCTTNNYTSVGECDIAMVYSVTDVAGLNQVLRDILGNAGAAIAAMAKAYTSRQQGHGEDMTKSAKRVGITMFGVTTPCVDAIRNYFYLPFRSEDVMPRPVLTANR